MSVSEFSAALQSEAYKTWFNSLEKNIVSSTVDKLRSSQQRAAKTDFLITAKDVNNILTSITGHSNKVEVEAMLQKLAENSGTEGVKGAFTSIGGQKAVKYTGIAFDTISTILSRAFDSTDMEHYLYEQTEKYKESLIADLKNDPTLTKAEYTKEWQKIERIPTFTIGTFFDKGHVISVGTNLTKQFRSEVESSKQLADSIKNKLISALDKYIQKLEDDDLASANMPKEVYQSITNINYTKSIDKYLVEMQYSIGNRESGRASKPIIEELRRLFTPGSKEIEKAFSSNTTGQMLLESKSSPTFLDILGKSLANTLGNRPKQKEVYTGKVPDKKLEKTIPIRITTNNNKTLIAQAKKLKEEIKAKKPTPRNVETGQFVSLSSIQGILNANLTDQITKNMGNGNRKDILNYRSGRLAESAHVERMSISKEGMITAFYTYMRNPYGTFSDGGVQSSPKTRDPKLLISKSIREIAATIAANRMRAVLV